VVILFNGMPSQRPAHMETIRNAKNGLNLAQDISNTRAMMQVKTISNVVMVNGYGK